MSTIARFVNCWVRVKLLLVRSKRPRSMPPQRNTRSNQDAYALDCRKHEGSPEIVPPGVGGFPGVGVPGDWGLRGIGGFPGVWGPTGVWGFPGIGIFASAKNRAWDPGCRFSARFLLKNRTWDPSCIPLRWLVPADTRRRGRETPGQVTEHGFRYHRFRASLPATGVPSPVFLQCELEKTAIEVPSPVFYMGLARGLRPSS